MLPKDPMILLSYLNTKLRDDYSTLEELCRSLDLDRDELEQRLAALDYRYAPELNRFV